MRASSLKWSITSIVLWAAHFFVVQPIQMSVDEETAVVTIWFCLIPVLSLFTARAFYLSFKKHYDLTPTKWSKTVNVISKVLSIAATMAILPSAVMLFFIIFALIAVAVMTPFS